jgi:amidase
MARSARDVALLYGLIAGHDPDDPTSWSGPVAPVVKLADLRGLVIGLDPSWNTTGCDREVVRAVDAMADALADLGATIREIAVPDPACASRDWELLAGTEAALAHAETYPARAADYGPALARLLDIGHSASAMEHQRPCAIA